MKYLLIISLLLCSCKSTNNVEKNEPSVQIVQGVPEIIKYTEPSFDNNEQNSGIIDFIPDLGWIITEKAAARYNLLINKFGGDFVPPILPNFGLSIIYNPDKKIILTQEAMVKFAIMNQKYKYETN